MVRNQQSLPHHITKSSGFPSLMALMPQDVGIGSVMATSGVCPPLWVPMWATSGCPARLVAGVRKAEAAGFTAEWSPRPPHLARGRDVRDRGGVEEAPWMFPVYRDRKKRRGKEKTDWSTSKRMIIWYQLWLILVRLMSLSRNEWWTWKSPG